MLGRVQKVEIKTAIKRVLWNTACGWSDILEKGFGLDWVLREDIDGSQINKGVL